MIEPEPQAIEPPFVWPNPLALAGASPSAGFVPFGSTVQSAVTLYGVVCAPSSLTVAWLVERLKPGRIIASRAILALYPGGPTTKNDLLRLATLQKEASPKVMFRVHALEWPDQRSTNLFLFFDSDEVATLVTGPSSSFGLEASDESQLNLVLRPDPRLRQLLIHSLDLLWARSADLDDRTIELPSLRPGDDEDGRGRAAWQNYMRACQRTESARVIVMTSDLESLPGDIVVDPVSGRVAVINEDGTMQAPPSEDIGLPHLDKLQLALSALAGKGRLVTIEPTSRIPPIETPVRPEWFGLESFSQQGAFKAQVSLRVSPFDAVALHALTALRQKPAGLLPKYTFPLANGVRWMPNGARVLFEAELQQACDDWAVQIAEKVGTDIHAFVEACREKIRRDADALYTQIKGKGKVDEAALDEILRDVEARLSAARITNLLPKLTYSELVLRLEESNLSSPWGLALTLLKAAAEAPRHMLKGKGWVDKDLPVLGAMDVFGDALVDVAVKKQATPAKIVARAKREWAYLEVINADAEDQDLRSKCHAIWKVITEGTSPA